MPQEHNASFTKFDQTNAGRASRLGSIDHGTRAKAKAYNRLSFLVPDDK
jgi:hypothetical protein